MGKSSRRREHQRSSDKAATGGGTEAVRRSLEPPFTRADRIFFAGWRPYAWIIGIACLLYARVLWYDFVYFDDNVLILDNQPFLASAANVWQAFREDVFRIVHRPAAYYRPLLTLSFMLDAWCAGAKPYLYYFSDIGYHALACVLLFRFLEALGYTRRLACVGALFFTVHPALVQAVAWVPGRNDSLLTVFALGAALLFVRYIKTGRWWAIAGHIACFAAAMFSKETAVVLPALLAAYVLLIGERPWRIGRLGIAAVSWPVVLLGYWMMRQAALASHPNPVTLVDAVRGLYLNAPAALVYIGKVFIPANLSVLPVLQDASWALSIVAVALVVVLLAVSPGRRWNYVAFAAMWFVVVLLPAFIRPVPQAVPDLIEHRVYLPLAGFIPLLLELGVVRWAVEPGAHGWRQRTSLAAVVAVFIVFAGLAVRHVGDYGERNRFWRNAVATSPHSSLAHANLCAMLYIDNKLDAAEVECKRALALNATEPLSNNNLGLIYRRTNRIADSERAFRRELEINPEYDDGHYNLGLLYFAYGRDDFAEVEWRRALAINPNHVDSYEQLAALNLVHGNLAKAREFANEVTKRGGRLNPELARRLGK